LREKAGNNVRDQRFDSLSEGSDTSKKEALTSDEEDGSTGRVGEEVRAGKGTSEGGTISRFATPEGRMGDR